VHPGEALVRLWPGYLIGSTTPQFLGAELQNLNKANGAADWRSLVTGTDAGNSGRAKQPFRTRGANQGSNLLEVGAGIRVWGRRDGRTILGWGYLFIRGGGVIFYILFLRKWHVAAK
jgi:hypothetical protein